MYVNSPSMEQIIARAHQMVTESVWQRLGVSGSKS
jgi:hypothetical protein